MTRAHTRFTLGVWLSAACMLYAAGTPVARAQQPDEVDARRRFEQASGRAKGGDFQRALVEFRDLVSRHGTTKAAGEAHLEIIRILLDRLRDLDGAERETRALLANAVHRQATEPQAMIFQARIALDRHRNKVTTDEALKDLESVKTRFAELAAYQEASYLGGEARRLIGECEDALKMWFDPVIIRYPGSEWAERSRVGRARCSVTLDRPLDAMRDLQRVRESGRAEFAAPALHWNTILHRLRVRAPSEPLYRLQPQSIAGASGKIKDMLALAVDAQGLLHVASRSAISVFSADGAPLPGRISTPHSLFLDRSGTVMMGTKGAVSAPGISIAIALPKPDGTSRPVESLRAVGMQSNGTIVAVDDETRTVQRFAPDGRHLGQMIIIGSGPVPDRMAVGPLDEIALMDEKTITIYNRDGSQPARIDFKGAGYLLRKPVDLAYDALGHLYVLDPETGSLVVFGPTRKLIATFTGPEKGPGSLRRATAIALDSQGTLYVADDATERVYVFK
jgi:hypothetical protein